jgi:L-aspartate oxidase
MKEIRQFDVVILGGGLAGIYTALNLDPEIKVGLFIKDAINRGSSNLAQGGICAEVDSTKEKIEEHIQDTLNAGSHLNNQEAVKILCSEADINIKNMINLGVNFDKDEQGNLVRTLEGGHHSRRILHAGGDDTGNHIMTDLRKSLYQRKNIQVFENEMAIEILHEDDVVKGVIVISKDNEEIYVLANKVVIATGGIGAIYQNTTNEKIACGDGIAMAYRIGVKVSNMEFVQFHPTAFYDEKPGQKFLISEAVRGEGAHLVNIEKERFMAKYQPEMMELAPRDKVSQAIYREMYDTFTDHVFLDITFKDSEFIKHRFPMIYGKCLSYGVDMTKDLIPVTPCEHFLCGGIDVDLYGHTNFKNLYAVGECANSGVHGANRLASNSLLECVVFGRRIAEDINKEKNHFNKLDIILPDIKLAKKMFNFKDIRMEVREIMSRYAFIVRTNEGLDIADKIISRHYKNLNKINVLSRYYYETLNMVTIAMLVIKQAKARKESIGSHFRMEEN